MSTRRCKQGGCDRPEGHHGHCMRDGFRFWRRIGPGPYCPAGNGELLADDCNACNAEIEDYLASSARAVAAARKAS